MTVTSTDDLAVGMFVSSGRAYSSDTKIESIDSKTEITMTKAALANSAGGGGDGTVLVAVPGDAMGAIVGKVLWW